MIHLIPDPGSGPSAAAPGEMRFVHAHLASGILGGLAAAGALAAWLLVDELYIRLVFTFGPALFALRFFRASLGRYELVIDPAARSWRRRTGPFFATRSVTGSLDDLSGVALTLKHISTGSGSTSRSIPIWSISLEFAGPDWDGTPLLIEMVEEDEPAAYRRLEHYAKRLRADAIDRTAMVDERRPWEDIDAPVLAPGSAPGSGAATGHPVLPRTATGAGPRSAPAAAPPSRTGIRVTVEQGRRRITLPPHGMDFGAVAGAGLGGLLATFGGYFALGPLRALGILGPDGAVPAGTQGGDIGVALAVAAAFVVVGIKAVLAALARARSREWVLDLPDSLRFGLTRGGRDSAWTELPKAAIEEVALRTPEEGGARLHVLGMRVPLRGNDPAAAALIRVRTDDELVRIGWRLSPEGKAWLRDTLAAAASDVPDA